mmetsp:Transcript_1776/g.5171  ORF Transcript_1776/g.5171 Transcript_1776/m.5171 type:complete len:201 (-) Transcript_1776:26-628(-)
MWSHWRCGSRPAPYRTGCSTRSHWCPPRRPPHPCYSSCRTPWCPPALWALRCCLCSLPLSIPQGVYGAWARAFRGKGLPRAVKWLGRDGRRLCFSFKRERCGCCVYYSRAPLRSLFAFTVRPDDGGGRCLPALWDVARERGGRGSWEGDGREAVQPSPLSSARGARTHAHTPRSGQWHLSPVWRELLGPASESLARCGRH